MGATSMSESDQATKRRRPTTLPAIKRVELPATLRNDGWWLCPVFEKPTARVLRFAKRPTRSRSGANHHG